VSAGDFESRLNVFIKRDFLDETKQPQKSASSYSRPNLRSTYTPPRNEDEEKIVGIWQSLLGVDKIGIHDNFFELGGHSLLGTQLMTRLRDSFEVDMSLRALFDAPTIAELIEVISRTRAERETTEALEILKVIEQLGEEEIELELSKRMQVSQAGNIR
jgi:acyl carrier protein